MNRRRLSNRHFLWFLRSRRGPRLWPITGKLSGDGKKTMARVISCHIALVLAAILAASLLVEAKSVGAQTSLLPPDKVGAQSTPDLTFSEITPPGLNSLDARHVDRSNPNAQDDLAHGSAANPWKTIGFAAAHLEPGKSPMSTPVPTPRMALPPSTLV